MRTRWLARATPTHHRAHELLDASGDIADARIEHVGGGRGDLVVFVGAELLHRAGMMVRAHRRQRSRSSRIVTDREVRSTGLA